MKNEMVKRLKNMRIIVILSLLFLMAGYLPARGDDLSSLKDELKQLGEKLDILEASAGAEEDYISPVIDLSGYYDFTFVDDTASHHGTFRQHHLTLFVGKVIKKFRFFSEIEFEYGPKIDLEGSSETSSSSAAGAHTHTVNENAAGTNKAEIYIETAWLEYNYSNWFSIRTGKHITPHGWWNVNHYPMLVLTTSRPESSKRIFPNSTTGVQVYGSIFTDIMQVDYNLYYINDIDNNATNKWDADSNKGIGGRLVLHLPILDKFDLGFSALSGRANGKNNGGTSNQYWGIDELIQIGPFELLSEFVYNNQRDLNRDGVDEARNEKGYYIQPSVTIPISDKLGTIAFVYRHDFLDSASTDSSGNNRNLREDKTINTIGLNYKPIPQVGIKSELNWIDDSANYKTTYHEIQFSINIFF